MRSRARNDSIVFLPAEADGAEAIAARVEANLQALEAAAPAADETLSDECLARLDSACRAAAKGRMTAEQAERLERVLRGHAQAVLDDLRAGRPVPRGVRARFERPTPAPWLRLSLSRMLWFVALCGTSFAAARIAFPLGVAVGWVGGLSLILTWRMLAGHRHLKVVPGPMEPIRLFALSVYAVLAYTYLVAGVGLASFVIVAEAALFVIDRRPALLAGGLASLVCVTCVMALTVRWLRS